MNDNKTYYLKRSEKFGTIELRQTKFKQYPNHPHAICIIAHNLEEMKDILEHVHIDFNLVDWTIE